MIKQAIFKIVEGVASQNVFKRQASMSPVSFHYCHMSSQVFMVRVSQGQTQEKSEFRFLLWEGVA